jgi:hypothetical protein
MPPGRAGRLALGPEVAVSAAAEEFLDRVLPHVAGLNREKFNHTSWRFANRPTSEGVGILPTQVDVESVVAHVLDVEHYPGNVKYVESTEMIEQRSDTDFTYIQRMNLPVIGRIQVQIHLADYGERGGYRVVAWDQDGDGTAALDKTRGARTQYNLGAWLIQSDAVAYALSSAPLKSDVGTLKFLAMTKGADVTAGEVIRTNIEGMVGWSARA